MYGSVLINLILSVGKTASRIIPLTGSSSSIKWKYLCRRYVPWLEPIKKTRRVSFGFRYWFIILTTYLRSRAVLVNVLANKRSRFWRINGRQAEKFCIIDVGHSRKLLFPTPRLSVAYIETAPNKAETTATASISRLEIGIPPPPVYNREKT